jgi:hypothetical protein
MTGSTLRKDKTHYENEQKHRLPTRSYERAEGAQKIVHFKDVFSFPGRYNGKCDSFAFH